MVNQTKKIALIGAGFVGASIAYSLVLDQTAETIVLIDLDRTKAKAEVDDIAHGLEGMGNAVIYEGDYSDCADSDLLIVTAGRGRKAGESRRDLADGNWQIIQQVLTSLSPYDNGCPILMITNPVDLLTAAVNRWRGQPFGSVFGSGCVLDSSRLVRCIARMVYRQDPQRQAACARTIQACVIGEHGDAQIPLWSGVRIEGQAPADYCAAHGIVWDAAARQRIAQETKKMGAAIIQAKGRTHFGIAACACRIARAVLHDEQITLSVSRPLAEQFSDAIPALSLPSVIGRKGIVSCPTVLWDHQEQQAFEESAAALREQLKALGSTAQRR